MTDHTPTPYFPENLDDYAPWVATYGLLAPYGKCQCGCGGDAPIARRTYTGRGQVANHPIRIKQGHGFRFNSLTECFWAHVEQANAQSCWEWRGAITGGGYGTVRFRGKFYASHRLSWEINRGPIADDLWVLHECDNRSCVNPNHLFLGTYQDNIDDMMNKGRHRPPRGSRQGNATLSEEHVIGIRGMAAKGISQREIAKKFNTGQSNVSRIISKERWRHV